MREPFEEIVSQIGTVVLGKQKQIQLALTCLLARGHLLIEDLPGIGKTTLAKVLSKCLGLRFQRIQFTSDLLPGDILGTSVFDRKNGSFIFHPGPIFTQVLLADEINRATPKTQSALLEAMEERQVTVEGKTRRLKEPFYVIATQNPFEQSGTFPLPESQLDRFLMRIHLGYPGREAEKTLLQKGDVQQALSDLRPFLTNGNVMRIQEQIAQVHASDTLLEYVEDLLLFSRSAPDFALGLSPRAGLSILRAARSWAFLRGRDFVLPEDVQKVLPWVVAHRLRSREDYREFSHEKLMEILLQVPVPT
ncbi:FIG022979: MoxR-like ATPases [Olavius algarvensis associated proteobacterium Delta 3]|nr:FIG022979: MoxR-like ATPases [Olavius algarvensis associated proteobacterium Delta 3]CAB5164531.1 FIG022979: MoxR-like ATPases [Olavius algarvensis associated proteobacterium Delta 3]